MREKMHTQNTQAWMIDMQERLMPAMGNRKHVTDRTIFLLQALKILGVPVQVSQQYTRGLGRTENTLMEAGGLEAALEKITFSCMEDETMRIVCRDGGDHVLVWGVEAHICVLQTVLDMLSMGKKVYLVCDCTDSRSSMDRDLAYRRMEQAGAVLTTSEAVIYELMGRAGSSAFKEISALVKAAPVNP